jgi:hypothetical protein
VMLTIFCFPGSSPTPLRFGAIEALEPPSRPAQAQNKTPPQAGVSAGDVKACA